MMRRMRKGFFGKAVSVFILVIFAITMNGSMGYAAASAIKMKHEPLAYFVPEKRIMVQAAVVQGAADVKLMRCYFRAAEQADYVFVDMTSEKDGVYQGILPAPNKETQTIEYLFLAADRNNQPIKTQVFAVNKQDGKDTPAWQQVGSEGNIQVSTELAVAPSSVSGFSDSMTMNVVESSARFGVVGGGGFSLYTWLGIGAAAAAAAGGIIAIDDGKDSESPPTTPDTVSTWEFHSRCANSSAESPVVFTFQLNETKGGSFNATGSGQSSAYEDNALIKVVIAGNYNTATREVSGYVDTISTRSTKLPFSCVRHDSFSFTIPLNVQDTGYQDVTEGSTDCGSDSGCKMQIRFIRK